VECISGNLSDEQAKVRTVTSLAIAALAEAANPYGIESFDEILNPLWSGARYALSFFSPFLSQETQELVHSEREDPPKSGALCALAWTNSRVTRELLFYFVIRYISVHY